MPEDVRSKPDATVPVAASQPVTVKAEKPNTKKLKVVAPEFTAAAVEEKDKVFRFVTRLQAENERWRAERKKKPWLLISILAAVALPTLVAGVYFFFIASDRYIAEARFAVRSNETQTFDMLGKLTGMPSSQTVSDSYIVADYIGSREMMKALEQRLSVRGIYADENADFLSRLDPDVTLEGLVAYWRKRTDVFYDSTKNTISVEVQAFTPGDAAKVASAVVDIARDLVNNLSAQARRDAVQFAASELARAELRVRGARQDILNFRLANNDLDPTKSAQATLEMALGLEAERSRLTTQLASVAGYLADDAPSVQMLKSRIAALAGEIGRIQSQVSKPAESDPAMNGAQDESARAPQAMANLIDQYQELEINQEFAEKAYASTLASVERARSDAERTQSYLAIYAHPDPTDEALYPERGFNVVVVLLVSAVLWAIGVLGFLTVRDHLG